MIELDGQNGGGQILRSALSLSMITGQPFHLKNIRGKRPKPGLMRQHLTCVQAAVEVSQAAVDGAEMLSRELIFHPGQIQPGNYHYKIGSAGSTTLIAQTLLPALANAEAPSTIRIEGGTHNPMAPPADFLSRIFFPAIKHIGFHCHLELVRHGFAPAGGGEIMVSIDPIESLKAHFWNDRGELVSRCAESIIARIDESIATRELTTLCKELGWPLADTRTTQATHTECSGNVCLAEIQYQNISEMITSFAAHNRRAETVAREASKKMNDYIGSGAVVGRNLADQLLLPLALASGGGFVTLSPSNHLETNIKVIEAFLPVKISVEKSAGLFEVTIH